MGFVVNHKKVLRLTRKLGVLSFVRPTRKYNSYKGEIGKIADNIIARDFFASEPLKKCYTDVTQFKIGEDRVYLAPIIDGYNAEIIAYNISFSPNMEQQYEMLSQLQDNRYDGMILHSDQGWQYQHITYREILKAKGIKQSMSRKGTSADNAFMESFFGVLKSEMYYGFENTFKNKYELKEAIVDYIKYYNEERIKKYGPVVPSVYEYYKDNGWNDIQVDKDEEIFAQEITLPMVLARFLQSLDEKNVIDSIQSTFEKYGKLTASELVAITHRKGTPWDHTNINDIITDENILKYHHVEK